MNCRKFSGTRGALHWWRNDFGSELPPRGYVWIVHGMGEHGARYAELARFLNTCGFDVLAPDLPGHGLSRLEGGQDTLASIGEVVDVLNEFVSFWTEQGPMAAKSISKTPWYLVGHSMGALISLAWIRAGKNSQVKFDFAKRAFISAPPLRLRLKVPAWKDTLSKKLEGVIPNLKLGNGILPEALSYDVANIEDYRDDPLVHGDASPKQYNSIVATSEQLMKSASDIEIPVCLAVGIDDPIVDPVSVREFFDLLGTHKKFVEFPKSKHEILNEVGRRACFEVLASWFL